MDNNLVNNFREQIYQKVEAFKNSLENKPVPVDESLDTYHRFIKSIGVDSFSLDQRVNWEQWYFRARIGYTSTGSMKPDDENYVSSFFMPPQEFTGWGRANLPKNPVFYGAASLQVAINEVQPKRGQQVFISVWRSGQFFPRYAQYIFTEAIQNKAIKRTANQSIEGLRQTLVNAEHKGLDQIPAAFLLASVKVISETFLDSDWTISSLIAHNNLYNSQLYDGIEYLDIKTRSSVNYALSPYAAKKLSLYRVYACQKYDENIIFRRVGFPSGEKIEWRPMTENDRLENDPNSPRFAEY